VSPVNPHFSVFISPENCWTLFGFGGLLPLFRSANISCAAVGSISMMTLVKGGEAKFFSMMDLAEAAEGMFTDISFVQRNLLYHGA
jgi:hypothetical protein